MSAQAAALCIATRRGGRTLTIVNLSPSLSPFVRVGDALTIDPCAPLRFGALVAVERKGRIVVHRLVRREAERLTLRGDANPFCDAPDDIDAVLGVVTRQRTRAGRLVEHGLGWRRLLGWALGIRGRPLRG